MASTNSSASLLISSDVDPELHLTLTIVSSVTLVGCVVAVVTKVAFNYVIPLAWKFCLLLHDIACLSLSVGLVLIALHLDGANETTCKVGGFFVIFGLFDLQFSLAFLGFTLLVIQNPSKMSQLSNSRWGLVLAIVLPEKAVAVLVALLPVLPISYFQRSEPYPLVCFPAGGAAVAYGVILFLLVWGAAALAVVFCVVNAVRFSAGPGTRIHASSPSLWHMQKLEQGRSVHKFCLLEIALTVVVVFVLTVVVYTNSQDMHNPQWITLLVVVALVVLHVVLAMVQLAMWSSLCGDKTAQKKEPHHRLKRLELIKIEGPGKMRLRASWTAARSVWKCGLLKVYGPSHIKAWAQEIVVLGLLRKSRSASVLQCLWTSNSNPYYETMTLISGDIVASDSRLTCLEMTSSGTLQELLKTMEVPLPEPCQRSIMHDIAEGLSHLHSQNVLHRNLTSAAVYLKGSVQCLVLRAAVGDFEDAQIYGTLLTGSPTSTITRKRFFLPDIRAYALVGLELVGMVCECRQRERQPHRRTAVKTSADMKAGPRHKHHPHDHHGNLHSHHQHHHSNHHQHHNHDHEHHDPKCNSEMSKIPDQRSRDVQQFETPEVPYIAPGEAEYLLNNVNENNIHDSTTGPAKPITVKSPAGHNNSNNKSVSGTHQVPKGGISEVAEQNFDKNWKLRTVKNGNNDSDWQDTDWNEQDPKWQEFKSYDDRFQNNNETGITQVQEFRQFEFQNHSVFKASEGDGEDFQVIDENIERGVHGRAGSKNGIRTQAGYVTSVGEDGREIFIPAVYTTKSSGGNSSSGYGSCGGSSIKVSSDIYIPTDAASFAGPGASTDLKQVHKTTSAATISSFEDDILEVLPGMTDVEEKPKRGEQLLRELLKAKQDAKVEQLIESYEERVRRGELGANLEGLPIGVVFPKKNRHRPGSATCETTSAESDNVGTDRVEDDNKGLLPGETQPSQKGKLSSPRPKTAMSSMSQRFQRASSRPVSASNSSFYVWNARSSLKRNRARTALRKALNTKGPSKFPLRSNNEPTRGKLASDVERKYGGRCGNDMSQSSTTDSENSSESNSHTKALLRSKNDTSSASVNVGINSCAKEDRDVSLPYAPSNSVDEHHCSSDVGVFNNFENGSISSTVDRKVSSKSRPAPPPPSSIPPLKPVQPVLPSHSVCTKQEAGGNHVDNIVYSLPRVIEESSNFPGPESLETASLPQSLHEQTCVEKIQSEMISIIESNSLSATDQLDGSGTSGKRFMDSGFDSASVSSEESCLCAAAALQGEENGSCSCPSEVYSQRTCSCACSNCLSTVKSQTHGSSWTGSQDSESWSNSNSFSSYDTNMYRRKLPRTKNIGDNFPGGVLAPDEQYPSPVHHSRGQRQSHNSLHPYNPYSPKRNHRKLPPSKGHHSSSASETSSAASRRYRELMKKGVPLRVSVVSGDEENTDHVAKGEETKHQITHQIPSLPQEDMGGSLNSNNALFQDLESQGFFESDKTCLSGPTDGEEDEDQVDDDHYQALSPIPSLEDIIKEIPDETGKYADEARAFLNRPESELSVKALQAVLSRHDSATDDRPHHNTELIIDRLFGQYSQTDSRGLGSGQDATVDLAESVIRELAMLPDSPKDEPVPADVIGLLSGMDGRHIRYCHTISSRLKLVEMRELLPATGQSFDVLKAKLYHTGSVGVIGAQILDLVRMCWLNETPPTSATIVDQLIDHVTETEL